MCKWTRQFKTMLFKSHLYFDMWEVLAEETQTFEGLIL